VFKGSRIYIQCVLVILFKSGAFAVFFRHRISFARFDRQDHILHIREKHVTGKRLLFSWGCAARLAQTFLGDVTVAVPGCGL
jgi:hypothetical protein